MTSCNKISAINKTIILFIALINQFLVVVGKSPLPIEDASFELLVSTLWTVITSIIAWWKYNSFTTKAIEAQEILNYLISTDKEETE